LREPEALATDARLFMVTPTAIRLVGCTRLGPTWNAAAPVSLEIDLAAGTVTPSAGGMAALLFPNEAFPALERAVRDTLAGLARETFAPMPGGVPPGTFTRATTRLAWETPPLAEGAVKVIRDASAVQPGAVVVAAGVKVVCLDASGKPLWEFGAQGTVNDTWVADLDWPGNVLYGEGPEILVASDDENLYVLNAAGQRLRELHIDYPLRVGRSSVRQPRVSNVLVGDLEGNGEPSVLVGTLNGNLARLNPALELQWRHDEIEHGTRELRLADLNADGKQEILAASKYGSVEVFSADGAELRGLYSELGDVEFAVGDINGDGAPEIVNGSSTGAFCCARPGGEVLWRFNNHGYAAHDVEIASLAGAPRVAVASETGYVYALDGAGNAPNQAFIGPAVRRLAFLPAGSEEKTLVVAGDDAGGIRFLTADLQPTGAAELGARVTALHATENAVVVGLADGRLAAVHPPVH